MKLEDVLKQQGYSDADLKAIEPMLADSRLRSAMEAQYSNLITERDAFKTEAEKWETWRQNEAVPTIDKFAREATEARTEAARLREENKIAKEYGFLPKTQEEDPAAVAAREAAARAQQGQPANFDTKNFVTRDDIGRYADAEGQAIAMAADLAEDYRVLTGQSIVTYTSPDGKRGMSALREEAKTARLPLDQYVANKFNFQAKREEIAAKQRLEAENAIRADERSKVAAEFGNPAMRSPMPSRHAIIPPKQGDTGMPWDKTPNELKERRMQNALKSLVQ